MDVFPIVSIAQGLAMDAFAVSITSGITIHHTKIRSALTIVGVKMIYESSHLKADRETLDPLHIPILFMLSIATSIDALAIGMSLSSLDIAIALPAIIIGVITFTLSFVGVYVGGSLEHFFERKIEIAGGIVPIGIGVKILVEHLQ